MEYKKVNQNINNIVNDQVRKLAQLFPAVVKDGEVDFEALREELGQFNEVNLSLIHISFYEVFFFYLKPWRKP